VALTPSRSLPSGDLVSQRSVGSRLQILLVFISLGVEANKSNSPRIN